ncbi:MAG: GFA family protein [Betaproteobacteria bacterium]
MTATGNDPATLDSSSAAPNNPTAPATGSCLCGAVRYEIFGKLRDVVDCHCAMCRKTHGHVGAYTAADKSALRLLETSGLRWYQSSEQARRGFCGECGGTLFWESSARDYISIAAGTLDGPTGLKTVLQIYVDDAGDYYEIPKDIPQRGS